MPPLLAAVVPEIPENRAEVVAARLARKIAPLFGVPWPEGPFGDRTWVSDFNKITLSEIARGAPLPTRAEAATLTVPATGWGFAGRIAVTAGNSALPNEIPNATLNRFGPDTRAAVVLTAVNRLLDPVRDAIESTLAMLVDPTGARLAPRLRLAAWAGLVIETFRSQPALVAAGIHARAIQNELVGTWQLPLALRLEGLPLTRCEVGSTAPSDASPTRPRTLDIADRTFATLGLDDTAELAHGATDAVPVALTTKLQAAKIIELLLRQLLAAGTPADASYLWLSERVPGQLAVEALLPSTGLISRFVQQCMSPPASDAPAVDPLPAMPTAERLRAMPVVARRAVLIALITVLRHVQGSPAGRDESRRDIVPVLAELGGLARDVLPRDDPVAALTACRVADMAVQTLRPDRRSDLRAPLKDLLTGLDRCEDLLRRGLLDRGAAAEAISSACVELNAVRRTNACEPASGLPAPDELNERLERSWQSFHAALEIPVSGHGTAPSDLPGQVGYHLQNYAAYLAGSEKEDDVAEAAWLFETVVIPARKDFAERSGHFLPLRIALQVASRASRRLGEWAAYRGDDAEARAWARLGRTWVLEALDSPETQELVAAERPTENASRFALLAVPALLFAAEVGEPDQRAHDRGVAAQLLDMVRRWEVTAVDSGVHHARHSEVTELSARLAALSGTNT